MNTVTDNTTAPITEPKFEIIPSGSGYAVTRNDLYLRDKGGFIRLYTTRNAARKRISRERTGNFHS